MARTDIIERLTAKRLVESYAEVPRLVDPPAINLEAAAEIARLRDVNVQLRSALDVIASGITPPDQSGHYLAHREAVRIARAAVKL